MELEEGNGAEEDEGVEDEGVEDVQHCTSVGSLGQ